MEYTKWYLLIKKMKSIESNLWNSNTIYCIILLAKIGRETKLPSVLQAILISPVQMVWAAAVSVRIVLTSLKLSVSISHPLLYF